MPENKLFPPEGLRPPAEFTTASLKEAAERHQILEAVAHRCGPDHTLHFSLDGIAGEMPRSQAVAPWVSGASREIAVLSRVGRPTCFTVTALRADAKGAPVALLSRREAQDQAMDYFLSHLEPGMVLVCRVTRLERFGVFLDVGCGIAAMLPIERISVSRISHPAQRFREGQKILAAVYAIDREARRLTGSCWAPGWKTPVGSAPARRSGAWSGASSPMAASLSSRLTSPGWRRTVRTLPRATPSPSLSRASAPRA